MTEKREEHKTDRVLANPTGTPGYILGVDYAKEGSERSAFRCPTCKTFQELVNENYLCKKCAKLKQENALLGI